MSGANAPLDSLGSRSPEEGLHQATMGSRVDLLRSLLHSWLASSPKNLEGRAALKDLTALDVTRPINPKVLALSSSLVLDPLLQCCDDWVHFVHREAVPLVSNIPLKARDDIMSPFAGGVSLAKVARTSVAPVAAARSINVAVFNPGRTGFSQLGTNELLHWRLEAVAASLDHLGVDVCIIPGGRLPPGSFLPPDFPYVWAGVTQLH